MAQNALLQAIEQIGREKGIDQAVIIHALEDAYAAAARKMFKTGENIVSEFDTESGDFRIFAKKKVVPEVEDPEIEISLEEAIEIEPSADFDMELRFPREVPELGRIAAQAAKQVIYQKVKEAEREKIYNDFIDRVGELINGIVKRFERGDMIVDLGATEGIVPRREQSRNEHYNQGDRIRAIIFDVERSGKGPQVVLSRADPRLVNKMFEMEVPEIYDGTVGIISTARDAGERTKIAVQSRDRDVDPVGACVGMKGNRVQSVIRELRGEKIDIVQFHDDAMTFAREALKPATVNRVSPKDLDDREAEVIVADDQLSLAIGRRGQNVRLAGRLVGWRIDIKSETEKRAEIDAEEEAKSRAQQLYTRLGLVEPVISALIDSGFRDLAQIIDADLEDLTRIPGIDVDAALEVHDRAEQLLPEVLLEEEEARRLAEELAIAQAQLEEVDPESLLGEDGPPKGEPDLDELLSDSPAEEPPVADAGDDAETNSDADAAPSPEAVPAAEPAVADEGAAVSDDEHKE
ncbi:MAG: transcription termination factor NusA [Acidobacteriota bacterium]|nr:transcription termination factor NusA [Acidobacteriota bacterium]